MGSSLSQDFAAYLVNGGGRNLPWLKGPQALSLTIDGGTVCAVCSVQCAVCDLHSAVCNVKCAVGIMQCLVCSVWFTFSSVQCALCFVHYKACTLQYAVGSVQRVVCWALQKKEHPIFQYGMKTLMLLSQGPCHTVTLPLSQLSHLSGLLCVLY